MLAIFLVLFATFTAEGSCSLLRQSVKKHEAGIYATGFLNTLVALGVFVLSFFFLPSEWRFSWQALPTLGPLVILSWVQAYVGLRAVVDASRSTYGFIRSTTIPLVLFVDLALGYTFSPGQIFGVLLIFFALFFLHLHHGLDRKGIFFVIFSAVNAAITISLYKYDITHYNSVAVEQSILNIGILGYFLVMILARERRNPFVLFLRPRFALQSLAHAVSSVASAFAYVLTNASIITALDRGLSVFWSVLFGRLYFHERHFAVRLVGCSLIVSGLACLVLLRP